MNTGKQGAAIVTYSWMTTGTKTISVTANNCGREGTAGDGRTISISSGTGWRYIYLPLVMRQ